MLTPLHNVTPAGSAPAGTAAAEVAQLKQSVAAVKAKLTSLNVQQLFARAVTDALAGIEAQIATLEGATAPEAGLRVNGFRVPAATEDKPTHTGSAMGYRLPKAEG